MKAITLALVVLVACGKPAEDPHAKELAKILVSKFAFEAYPQWAAAHADKECPATIGELLEYTNDKAARDPWGNELRFDCNHGRPTVRSAGPDGKLDTPDDIVSK
jgi:hypothetical protein